ncbi:polycystin-1 [Ambystoma mexicanum]|uniref:polycystin-1 n=1 Tax=Ambystoma mexicanum TaxID=8296 RepID=UPI0037E9061E
MPPGAGQLPAPGEHGAHFLPCLLLLLCLLLLGGARGCQPCPPNCTCDPAGGCNLNCSGALLLGPRGLLLEELGVPPEVTRLDLSHNEITYLDDFEPWTSLEHLDISNNQISTLKDGLFDHLFNLSEINLSWNPFLCDCKLSWLPSWLEEKQITVLQPSDTRCHHPPHLSGLPLLNVSFSNASCDADYIACLLNNRTETHAVVSLSPRSAGNTTQESCAAHCFTGNWTHGALDHHGRCLCGNQLSPETSLGCLPMCTEVSPSKHCGPSLIPTVFPSQLVVLLEPLHNPYTVLETITLSVSVILSSGNLQWDFGDGTVISNTTMVVAFHQYILPGHYNVTVSLFVASKVVSAQTVVDVEAPPDWVDLQCPSPVMVNTSLDISIKILGGSVLSAVYSITNEQGERVAPMCPVGGSFFPGNDHCYRLIVDKADWFDAQRFCQDNGNGDLAVVSSTEVLDFLVSDIISGLTVWIRFNDSLSSDAVPGGDGFDLESCQNWLPGEPHPSMANRCVRMGPKSQCNTDLCSSKENFVCEYKPEEIHWNAEYFLSGNPIFGTQDISRNLTRADSVSTPVEAVEVMIFPNLSLKQEAFVTAFEFVTQNLLQPTQMRFQVYVPSCEERYEEEEGSATHDDFTSQPPILQNTSDWNFIDCSNGMFWCPSTNTCVALNSDCSPEERTTDYNSSVRSENGSLPCYSVVKEWFFLVPSGKSTRYLVSLEGEGFLVGLNHTFGIQHDADPGMFLQCLNDTAVPQGPGYFSINSSDWLSDIPGLTHGTWHNETDCVLRVFSTEQKVSPVIKQRHNSGMQKPGLYTVKASVQNTVSTTNVSCHFLVITPISGLQVIYPAVQSGIVYGTKNQTFVGLKIRSGGADSLAYWEDGNQTSRFQATCPAAVTLLTSECVRETSDTWFSVIPLEGLGEGLTSVLITAKNVVSSQNITVSVKEEEPIRGLSAQPDPETRVLLNNRVSYQAILEAGSDAAFKWTVDDKPSFTYYNIVFNVIYQSAAVYKLTLTASNHISNVSVSYNVTVEKMNKMKDLAVFGVPAIAIQGLSIDLTASVHIDSAVEASFRWTFGDHCQDVGLFKPPYNQSFLVPNIGIHQVVIEHNVTHVYQEPGEYTMIVIVANKYENLTQRIPVHVHSYLANISLEAEEEVLVAGRDVTFEAHLMPSPYGALLAWDFGDGSTPSVGHLTRVNHTYINSGLYSITVTANNTISELTTSLDFLVWEEITGLNVSSDEVTEKGMLMMVNASVETGANITWVFDMGDGTKLQKTVSFVQHVYTKEGNYTINVTARNLVNSVSQCFLVRVFVLEVLKIDPSSCIMEQPEVTLTAHVSGDYSNYIFDWTIGDGSPNISIFGNSMVVHNFTRSGIFPLCLTLSSKVNKAHYFTTICVEPNIVNVTIVSFPPFLRVGVEHQFQVYVFPLYKYTYIWNFGTNDSERYSGTEVNYTYRSPGLYLVSVTVFNNISSNNDTAFVEIQEPVGIATIKHNGTKVLEIDQVYLFTASGNATNARYQWEFGDGTILMGQLATHTYNSSGSFTVTLLSYNDVSSSEATLNLTVKRRVHGLAINASRTVVPLNGSVNFIADLLDGDDVRYSWILCDRCTAIVGSSTICYTFRSIGTFNVIVIADNEISSQHDSIFIYVLQYIEGLQIIANEVLDGCCFPTNRTLLLQAVVGEGTNISYTWTVLNKDGLVQSVSGKVLSLSSHEAETYNVILKATNMLGGAMVNRTVQFVECVGDVRPQAFPNPVAVNASVNISASVSSGSSLIYTWHLPDRNIISTLNSYITHIFKNPGILEVTIIAENQLGSSNATIPIFVQEPVVGLRLLVIDHHDDYVPSGYIMLFHGQIERGTNVSYRWILPNSSMAGPIAAVPFPTPGFFTISLQAYNNVSWAVATKNITVEDKIQGLELIVSRNVVEPGENVTFTISMSSGSSLSYYISISGDCFVLSSPNYTHEFTKVGDYHVTVIVQNQVSIAQTSVVISVLEVIQNLGILNCCEPGMPTGIEKMFTAEVSNGSLVAYTWQFDLQGHSVTSLAGQSVSFTPEGAGLLKIHLSASNRLGGQNITKIIRVQYPIVEVSIKPVNTFVNRTVLLEVLVLPSAWEVVLWWSFGDGSPSQSSTTTASNHSYFLPGDFLLEVNATNLISFCVFQSTITVRTLECEEPEVQLVLPPQVIMKRSQRNYIEAEINLRGCISYQTEHLWKIYRASSCLSFQKSNQVILPGVDMSRPQLVIPKLALEIGDYCFVFAVSFGDTPLSNSIFANVTMTPSKLVPIIDGGSYRVWSNSRSLVLDGEKSYDPNLDDEDQTPLRHTWTCTSSSKGLTPWCDTELNNGGIIIISKDKLEAGVEYTFDLTISKPGRNPESTNQTVLIKKGSMPIVSLKCVSCKAQAVYEVSKSSYLYLEGSCRNCQGEASTAGRWTAQSFNNKSFPLDMSTTTTGNIGMNLVLRQGFLKDGEGYTFTLHVTDPSMDEEGYASIDLLPNSPPSGGHCRVFPNDTLHALTTKVHFECMGWQDSEDEEASLVFSLIITRCKSGHCDEFCVYKGSRSEHSAFLPIGFHQNQYLVDLSVVVQDQKGAAIVAMNRSLVISLPSPPDGLPSLAHWLSNLTETTLPGLVKQGDPQHVTEYSLALITVLNEYEGVGHWDMNSTSERELRLRTRANITHTLISLKVNNVDDIRQIAAALAQCTVAYEEHSCGSCQRRTLNKLEAMMDILQNETTQGTMTPTTIADNILNIMGDLIHLVNTDSALKTGDFCSNAHSLSVASKAYNLSSDLMQILMKGRVLNEEPLKLEGGEIVAQGKRSDPLNLLCYSHTPGCQFSIPEAFNSTFSDLPDVIQVIFGLKSNPFPFGYIHNYTLSTKVASMVFHTHNGTQIPVESLDSSKAITVMVTNSTAARNITAGNTTIEERGSVNVVIRTLVGNREAGLHIRVSYQVLNERYLYSEEEPFITAYLHQSANPNEYNCSDKKKIGTGDLLGTDHKLYTFFVFPGGEDAAEEHHLNITNHYRWSPVAVTVGLYTSLCQYFNENEKRWETDGIIALEDTTPEQAVCLTTHLTSFGASLFVPPSSVHFIFPPPPPGINYIVLLTCAVCFVTYSVAAIIVHKLDLIDVNKVGVIPFCGKSGFYKYEILVKTGWGRGSGTTAHVGINLYGVEDKSGHRHLDGDGTFHRNSLDVFQIATERSLGSLWKIRIWHDNKGLSPSWYLQHVIVKDLHSGKRYFFLANDWLSVGREGRGHMVEKEVLAASESELRKFSRIFVAELQRGLSEKHVWLSMWDRPPRSRFTRVQRATCCWLLIFLFFCVNAVWYGVVSDSRHSDIAISRTLPVSVDTVAVGLVSSAIVYPLYLFVSFVFRMARSKSSTKQSLTYFDQQSLEIDDYLDSPVMESSFQTFSGTHKDAFSDHTKTDLTLEDSKSLIRLPSNEGLLNWPDLLSDPSIMGSTIQRLKRGRASRHLGIDAPVPSMEDSVSFAITQAQSRLLKPSDGASTLLPPQELGLYTRTETHLLTGFEFACVPGQDPAAGGIKGCSQSSVACCASCFRGHGVWSSNRAGRRQLKGAACTRAGVFTDKAENIQMQKLNEKGLNIKPVRGVSCSAKSTRTVLSDALRKHLFPSWCTHLAHTLSFLLFAASIGVSIWIGVGFASSVGLMWLISGVFSFLASFFIWEPVKVLFEAVYFALVAKRLHPEEDDTLVESPVVEHVSEKINKVRPPQGFALYQAKEEARKVKLLHRMLKEFLVYMLFFLVVLLTNYGDAPRHSNVFLLQSSTKQELSCEKFLRIKRSDEFWAWITQVLLPGLYNKHSSRESFSPLLGAVRLRQIRLKKDCQGTIGYGQSGAALPTSGSRCSSDSVRFDTTAYEVGWKGQEKHLLSPWSYSPPDLSGVWYWGYLSLYDSGGYIQELSDSFEENKVILRNLQQQHWINNLTMAVFVELTQYNPAVVLHTVVTLMVEFPFTGRALPSVDIQAFPLLRLGGEVHLLLIMMVFLMGFVVYFVISESLAMKKEGSRYFTNFWNYVQWLIILLTICTVIVHMSRGSLADQQWAKYLLDRKCFTNFYQVATLSTAFNCLAASILFILTLQAAHQLRFIRQWSIFGKTLRRSSGELFCAWVAFLVFALAYAQLGFLLFSSGSEQFHSFGSSLLTTFDLIRGSLDIQLDLPLYPGMYHIYCMSYLVLQSWILLRLFVATLLHNFSQVRHSMYRPAYDPQDYEMVQLLLRRLRMWMGISKVKEFRHKVRFEGMEPLPSRSSSDSKSLRGGTPSAASDTSSASLCSSQLDSLSTVTATDHPEVDINTQQLMPVLDTLLLQFDRVNQATEDVYQMECRLVEAQSRITKRKYVRMTEELLSRYCLVNSQRLARGRQHRERASPCSATTELDPSSLRAPPMSADAVQCLETNAGSIDGRTTHPFTGATAASVLLPFQRTHSEGAPVKKRKSFRAKNKVHPSVG